MGKNIQDQVGKRYGRLIVQEVLVHRVDKNGRTRYKVRCLCDCGNEKIIVLSGLQNKNTQSCGCKYKDVDWAALNTKHGKSRDRVYRIYKGMLNRCNNPKCEAYSRYGGRGIQVKYNSFEEFYADMGDPPAGMSIDRIDNDGHYEPSNCRWATKKTQANNTRRNHMITYDGKTRTLSEWAQLTGLSYGALKTRLRRGWSVKEALTTPKKARTDKRVKRVH